MNEMKTTLVSQEMQCRKKVHFQEKLFKLFENFVIFG